jgi:chaperonin GroES
MRGSSCALAALFAALPCAWAFLLAPSKLSVSSSGPQQLQLQRAGARLCLSTLQVTLNDEEVAGELTPLVDCVIVKVDAPKEMTDGGLFLPTTKKSTPTVGTVVATGPGRTHRDTGVHAPMQVKEGQRVMWGGRLDSPPVKIDGVDHLIMTESDLLLTFTGEAPTLETISMVGDRILLAVERHMDPKLASGIVVSADAAKERPRTTGAILAQGKGRVAPTGVAMPMQCEPGDMVKFRDFSVEYISTELLDIGGNQECGVIRSTDVIATF